MNFLTHLPLFTNGDICENALLRQTKIAHKINMLGKRGRYLFSKIDFRMRVGRRSAKGNVGKIYLISMCYSKSMSN